MQNNIKTKQNILNDRKHKNEARTKVRAHLLLSFSSFLNQIVFYMREGQGWG